jgi:hypothetical protein
MNFKQHATMIATLTRRVGVALAQEGWIVAPKALKNVAILLGLSGAIFVALYGVGILALGAWAAINKTPLWEVRMEPKDAAHWLAVAQRLDLKSKMHALPQAAYSALETQKTTWVLLSKKDVDRLADFQKADKMDEGAQELEEAKQFIRHVKSGKSSEEASKLVRAQALATKGSAVSTPTAFAMAQLARAPKVSLSMGEMLGAFAPGPLGSRGQAVFEKYGGLMPFFIGIFACLIAILLGLLGRGAWEAAAAQRGKIQQVVALSREELQRAFEAEALSKVSQPGAQRKKRPGL